MAQKGYTEGKHRDRIGLIMYLLYLVFLLAAVVVLVRIAYLQVGYELDPSLANHFKPNPETNTLEPDRGSILAQDGRLLAISTPMYQVYMDCAVQKKVLANNPEGEKAWREKAYSLSEGLAEVYGDHDQSYYYKLIISNREDDSRRGRRHVKIGGQVDYAKLKEVKNLPLFREGQNKGGIIVEKKDTRQYPYGSLARKAIGYVKDNSAGNGNNHLGLEGKFDYQLHGEDGFVELRISDNNNLIPTRVQKPKNGLNLRSTLNIDIQDIADVAVRKQILSEDRISGGCAIVMDVSTGAIRAMVNLMRDSTGRPSESINYAVVQKSDPGSVFKTALLMSLLDDGKVSLKDEVPTNHGVMDGFTPDQHVVAYEWETGKRSITVLRAFELSLNSIFRRLAIDNYGQNPQKYIDKLYNYKLAQNYDFDLEGFASPDLPKPGTASWSKTSLGSIAIGYSITETPLHICTFYNAIANRGKMMRPYLVECMEDGSGNVKEKYGPDVLNGAICSKATADTLVKALSKVVEEGTGRRVLADAACSVAGKTGTARMVVNGKYEDSHGRVQYQGTFVGFFPAESPKYTCIVVMYSKPGTGTLYGAGAPARAFREIVDRTYMLSNI